MASEIPLHGGCDDRFERVREIFRKGFAKDAELGASVCFTHDGFRILRNETIEAAIEEQVFGPDVILGQLPMRLGLGFMLRQDLIPLGPNPRAFGHAGAEGSLGFADPDAHVGFGYTMNRMRMSLVGTPTALAMIRAFFKAL